MATKRSKHPELDCPPIPSKLKETPTVNGDGQELGRCRKCDGSGSVVSAQKEDKKAAPTPPHVVYINGTGADVTRLKRQGYTLECTRCTACGGAGLVVEGK